MSAMLVQMTYIVSTGQAHGLVSSQAQALVIDGCLSVAQIYACSVWRGATSGIVSLANPDVVHLILRR